VINLDSQHLLYIEPKGEVSEELTDSPELHKLAAAWRNKKAENYGYRGWHTCSCGARSDNKDWRVCIDGKEYKTNSLALHYLESHYDEIPASELEKLRP